MLLVFVAGIGIAAYHPEGAKFAAFASGRKRASGMSYFNIGGNTGYALGPIVVTPLVLWLGLGGGTLAMVPVLVVAAVLLRRLPELRRIVPVATARRAVHGHDDVRAMSLLGVVIALRSVAWFGLLTFVPLWVVANGGTEGEGGRELSLMLVSGAVGTLVLGPVADRIGLRRTLLVTQASLPFLIVVFVAVGGVIGTLALMLVGLCVVGTFGVTMVLSQLYLPRHVGDGERPLRGPRDGPRRDRGRRARRPGRRDRPRDGALRGGRRPGDRVRRLSLPAAARRARCAAGRVRHAGDRLTLPD